MKQRGIAIVGVAILTVALTFGTAYSVYAEDGTETAGDSSTTSDSKDVTEQEVKSLREEVKNAREKVQTVKDRLAGRRLKACQAHQAAIQTILTRAGKRGDNHIALFSKITDRVETFYQTKGKTLATYDQLVSAVAAKKTAAQAAVDTVKAADTTFDCGSDNPKAQVAAFRAEVKAEIAALKEYRTAVKNLIVGVKSVQSTSENGA
jgi:uncharacterized coiled-coil DUF342 family protein